MAASGCAPLSIRPERTGEQTMGPYYVNAGLGDMDPRQRQEVLKVLNAGHMAVMDQPQIIDYIMKAFG